ncbi:MAG: hypothetical protein ACXV2D_09470, partial [Halobacteriota archaeon]
MIDLGQAVFDIIAAEMNELKRDELIATLQRNALEAPKMGVMVPGSGCRFCLPQHDDLRHQTESEFECDLKACMIHSLVSHTLGILQDADLMIDMTNVTTARNRLIGVLQMIFSEQKSEEIAARLMKTLEATDQAP